MVVLNRPIHSDRKDLGNPNSFLSQQLHVWFKIEISLRKGL